MALVKRGADRQEMHERIRKHTLAAWEEIQRNQAYPLNQIITKDEVFLRYLSKNEIKNCMDASGYLGDAPQRAMKLVEHIKEVITSD
jgi:adenylosuccinate lyase